MIVLLTKMKWLRVSESHPSCLKDRRAPFWQPLSSKRTGEHTKLELLIPT